MWWRGPWSVHSLGKDLFLHCEAPFGEAELGLLVERVLLLTYVSGRDFLAPSENLRLAHHVGVGARTFAFELDLLDDRSNFRMENLKLPVKIDVLPKVPE